MIMLARCRSHSLPYTIHRCKMSRGELCASKKISSKKLGLELLKHRKKLARIFLLMKILLSNVHEFAIDSLIKFPANLTLILLNPWPTIFAIKLKNFSSQEFFASVLVDLQSDLLLLLVCFFLMISNAWIPKISVVSTD